jgi:hypothetical protein
MPVIFLAPRRRRSMVNLPAVSSASMNLKLGCWVSNVRPKSPIRIPPTSMSLAWSRFAPTSLGRPSGQGFSAMFECSQQKSEEGSGRRGQRG